MMNIQLQNNKVYNPCFKANVMPKGQAEFIDDKFLYAESIDIFCHSKADEDSANSAKAIYSYLEGMGKNVRIIANPNPQLYKFSDKKYNILPEDKVDKNTIKADLAVCIDFSKDERLKGNVLDYLHDFSSDNVVGFDHHDETKLIMPKFDTYKVVKSYDSIKKMPVSAPKNYYIDSSAKSCAAIIYRFFEALGKDISYDERVSLFCGMCDDMRKSAYINFLNKPKIEFSSEAENDTNTKEVYDVLLAGLENADKDDIIKHIDPPLVGLEDVDKDDIIKHVDTRSESSPAGEQFQKKIFDNVQINSNGKLAYTIIDINDPIWRTLGGDNPSTRRIVKDSRARLLQNSPYDELIPDELRVKLNDVQVVATIDSDFVSNEYHVSLTSKGDYVKKYADYVREKFYPDLKEMGHSNRGGWSIPNGDEKECAEFLSAFMEAAENISYDGE